MGDVAGEEAAQPPPRGRPSGPGAAASPGPKRPGSSTRGAGRAGEGSGQILRGHRLGAHSRTMNGAKFPEAPEREPGHPLQRPRGGEGDEARPSKGVCRPSAAGRPLGGEAGQVLRRDAHDDPRRLLGSHRAGGAQGRGRRLAAGEMIGVDPVVLPSSPGPAASRPQRLMAFSAIARATGISYTLSSVRDTRIVSPRPSSKREPIPIALLIRPSSPSPASVTPRWSG